VSDRLLGRPVCAAGQPASMQVSRCIGLSGSDRKFPGLPGRSGTQRARRPFRPELAAPLSVWPSPQLAQCAAGRDRWRLSGDVAVLRCCPAPASSAHPRSAPPTRQPSTFRSDISQVGADRASVMRCRGSLPLVVERTGANRSARVTRQCSSARIPVTHLPRQVAFARLGWRAAQGRG